jgi:uncharacterized protein (DUF433 family)
MRVEVGKYIVVDDEICHGKPTFKGTRVLVSDVIELLAAGLSIEEIIRDYYPSLNEDMIKEMESLLAKVKDYEGKLLIIKDGALEIIEDRS